MTDEQLLDLTRRTLNMLETLAQEIELRNVTPEQEIGILSQLGPVILGELIASEKDGV